MKKLTCIILIALIFAFSLCGCSSYETQPLSETSTVSETAITTTEKVMQTETQAETQAETQTETQTQKQTESTTKKQTYNNTYGNSNSKTVYITDTGEKYHASGCQYLKKSKHAISLSDAKNRGYTPCSKCRP